MKRVRGRGRGGEAEILDEIVMVHEMGERFTQTASLMSGMRRVKWPSATGIGQLPASLPVKNSCSELIMKPSTASCIETTNFWPVLECSGHGYLPG